MRHAITFGLLLTTLAGCGVSQDQYTAKESEARKYKAALSNQQNQTAALEQQNAGLQQQTATLQKEVGTLKKQLSEASAKVQATSAQKSALESKTFQLQAETGMLKGQQAAMVDSQLLFKENSSKLTPEAKRTLDTTADAIKQLDDKAVVVTAFTDDTEGGKTPAGVTKRWQLSTARALEVAKYLVSRGLDPSRIAVAGFGESRPAAPNDSLANRALNRRAEILLTPRELTVKTVDVAPAKLAD